MTRVLVLVLGCGLLAAVLLRGRFRPVYSAAGLIVLNVLVLLAALEVAAGVALWLLPRPAELPALSSRNAEVSWYRSKPWGAAYWREFRVGEAGRRYEPYVLWRKAPARGPYINVDSAGLRATPGADCRPGSYTVFVFGGSAAWGWGSPDSATIPAYLQAELGGRAPSCVVNFGQLGWVSSQEVVELTRQLQAGHVPALAIFYDGYNDIVVSRNFRRSDVHGNYDYFARRFRSDVADSPLLQLLRTTGIWRLAARLRESGLGAPATPRPLSADSADRLAAATAEHYLANVKVVAALATAYRFDYAFFWQPILSTSSKPLTAEERAYPRVPEEAFFRAVDGRVRASAGADRHLYHLGSAFDGRDSTIFIDQVHVTPAGNAIIARQIALSVLHHP